MILESWISAFLAIFADNGRLDQFALGRLLLELDLIAYDVDDGRLVSDTGALGKHLETYHGVLGATNHVDHVILDGDRVGGDSRYFPGELVFAGKLVL